MVIQNLLILISLLFAAHAQEARAATQTVSATITFATQLNIINQSDIDFGSVKAAQAGTYTITPEGVVTASNEGVLIGGSGTAGSLTISGSTTQTIDISASNYTSD